MARRTFYVRDADNQRSTLYMTETREQAGSYTMRCALDGLIGIYHVYRFKSEYGDDQWMVDRDDRPALAQCDTLISARTTVVNDLTNLRWPPAAK